MNLSLKKRIAISFIIANCVILVLSFTVFDFLNSFYKKVNTIVDKSNRGSLYTEEVRISTISILKYQRQILTLKAADPELVEKVSSLCEGISYQLQQIDSLYNDPEIKKVVAKMAGYVESLKVFLSKATFYSRDNAGLASFGELADKILEAFTDFQDIQFNQMKKNDEKIREVIKETQRRMMITLIIGFLGTILLNLVVPGKIALPFKKINDAIRELQDCNFDVSIFYNQDDEIGEIAREMNKMIMSFKKFEELRQDRVSVELRKFDALANLVKKPVLVANAKGQIIYMNNVLYSLLQIQSDDVIYKNMSETPIPESIIEAYELAIKRRSKIENAEILIPSKPHSQDHFESDVHKHDKLTEELRDGNHDGSFEGYANVIPIRGKDSSLDYYLMVLSNQVFV